MGTIGQVGILNGYRQRKQIEITRHGSFTQTYTDHLNSIAIITQDNRPTVIHSARWDTGSELTYIATEKTSSLAPAEGESIGAVGVDGKPQHGAAYYVDIELPGQIKISNVSVGELDLSRIRECEAIIGMDIIRQGRLIVDKDKFTFEV